MLFENLPIDPETLPAVETLEFRSLEREYLKVSNIGSLLFFGLLIIVFLTLSLTGVWKFQVWVQLVIGAILLLLFGYSIWYNYRNFRIQGYALREHDISYQDGVFFFTLTTIPFNRVQHCEVKQGPVERWFGLNTLQVFTAGGQTSDLVIPGLAPENAQQLKT
ncbi:MAG: PH domain-containing protein, partial [Bacteroidota bacterium]